MSTNSKLDPRLKYNASKVEEMQQTIDDLQERMDKLAEEKCFMENRVNDLEQEKILLHRSIKGQSIHESTRSSFMKKNLTKLLEEVSEFDDDQDSDVDVGAPSEQLETSQDNQQASFKKNAIKEKEQRDSVGIVSSFTRLFSSKASSSQDEEENDRRRLILSRSKRALLTKK